MLFSINTEKYLKWDFRAISPIALICVYLFGVWIMHDLRNQIRSRQKKVLDLCQDLWLQFLYSMCLLSRCSPQIADFSIYIYFRYISPTRLSNFLEKGKTIAIEEFLFTIFSHSRHFNLVQIGILFRAN